MELLWIKPKTPELFVNHWSACPVTEPFGVGLMQEQTQPLCWVIVIGTWDHPVFLICPLLHLFSENSPGNKPDSMHQIFFKWFMRPQTMWSYCAGVAVYHIMAWLDGVDSETYWSSRQSHGCSGLYMTAGWSKKEHKWFSLEMLPEEGRATLHADWSVCFCIDFRLGWAAVLAKPLVLSCPVWPEID